MTRDQWCRLKPIVTKALSLPEHQQEAVLKSEFIDHQLLEEIIRALRLSSGAFPPPAAAAAGGVGRGAPPGGDGRGAPPGGAGGGVPPGGDDPPWRRRFVTLKPDDSLDGGRYRIIRQIARGGMGSVYLANDTHLGTLVALKAMPNDERVLTEARRAASCLGHPHVATVLNVTTTEVGGEVVGLIVMEYVEGKPASLLASEGSQDIRQVLRWGREVASAIGHAHSHHVLHCDLKPGNIVITPEGHAKVLDFGIARTTLDAGGADEPLCGTPPYMAPEQLFSGEFTEAGDIYSLGVTLYELISGQRPFDGDEFELRVQIQIVQPPALSELVPGVPPKLQDAIEKALAKQPEKRFRSARQFERELKEIEVGIEEETTNRIPVPTPIQPPLPLPAPAPAWEKAALAAMCLTGLLAGVTALGAYTSTIYNLTLERAGFATETVWDWLTWGRRASVGPFVVLVAASIAAALLGFAWRLLTGVVAPLRHIERRVRRLAAMLTQRMSLDDVGVWSAVAVAVPLAVVVAAMFAYRDLLPAFVTFAKTGEAATLALLAPEHVDRHNGYRRVFSLAVIIAVAVWYPVLRTPRGRAAASWGALASGGFVILVALVLLHHPHRLMFSELAGDGAEAVRWQDNYCYVLGQRGSDTLLLCPELTPPRHRIVRTAESNLVPLGIRESVFRGFHRAARRTGTQGHLNIHP